MQRDEHNYLLLVWQNPVTRRNYTVGKLTKADKFYFEYCEQFEEARDSGWNLMEAFPENKKYESKELFPAFSSRLPDKKRRDIKSILKKYNLDCYDGFELLRRSEARLPIDTYQFVDPIFPEDETIQRDFFIMGIRHNASCLGENCGDLPNVKVGDYLRFIEEPENQYDNYALRVETMNGEHLGYVPRYYNRSILDRLKKDSSYSCCVVDINQSGSCAECIKVRLNIPSVI